MSLRRKIQMLGLLGVLAVITSGALLYQASQRSHHITDSLLAHAELLRLNDYVERHVVSRLRSASVITYAVDAAEYLSRPTPAATEAMNRKLKKLQEELAVNVIYVMDNTGMTVAASNFNDAQSFIGHNFQVRDYFQSAAVGLPYQEVGLGMVTGEFGAYYSYPIVREGSVGQDSAQLLGVLVIKDFFQLPLLSPTEASIGAGEDADTSVTVMVGPDGNIIASNRRGWTGHGLPIADLQGADNREIVVEGETYTVISTQLLDFPGWHLLRLNETRHWLLHALSPLATTTGALYLLLLCAITLKTIRLYREAARIVRKREHANKLLRRSHERYRQLSCRDALTGLYNRRKYQSDLAREMQRAQRYSHHLSVALLDIDFFKKINDTYGHETGDRVLRRLAELIRTSLRETDFAYRIGGEEFLVLLPETPVSAAQQVIERIQGALADIEFRADLDEGFCVTFSCGVVAYNQNETAAELFERADALLYAVKDSGRNGIRIQGKWINSSSDA